MSEPLSPQCHACFRPLSYGASGLEFVNSVDDKYPDAQHPEHTIARYACVECESGAYWIDFARLVQDGLDGPSGWATHLQRKMWFRYSLEWDLVTAHELAVDLKRIHDAPRVIHTRSVVDSIPRRPPRAPSNPRNISPSLRARVLERDTFRCRRCGCGASHARLVVDHIVPVAKGGTADFDNLQTLCDPCNAGKSDRAPHPRELRGEIR